MTPYRIPPLSPEGARAWTVGEAVKIPSPRAARCGAWPASSRPVTHWQALPGDLGETRTLEALSSALFARDPVRWAPHDLLEMSAQARSDFRLLHFEFWRNTDYRYAVTEIRPGRPRAHERLRLHAPERPGRHAPRADQGRCEIWWVLGKPPKPQPPIKPRPVPKPPVGEPPKDGPKTIVVTPLRPDIGCDLAQAELAPAMKLDGTGVLASRLTFTVTLDGPSVKTTLQIRKNGDVYYEEVFDKGLFLEKGEHPWEWDGFGADGVLDTERLKRNRWSARVLCVDKAGRTAFGSAVLTMTPAGMPWSTWW